MIDFTTDCYKCKHACSNESLNSALIRCEYMWKNHKKSKDLHPKGSAYGKEQGWWDFPYDFDPVWMITPCTAFTPKVSEQLATTQ